MSSRPPSAVSQEDALGALPATQRHFGWGQGAGKGRGWSQRPWSLPAGEPAGGLRALPCTVGIKIPLAQGWDQALCKRMPPAARPPDTLVSPFLLQTPEPESCTLKTALAS